MNFQEQINYFSTNNVELPECNFYSAILGLNPSKGARSPSLWNSAYREFGIDAEMIPIDVTPENFEKLMGILESDASFVGGAIAAPHKEIAANFVNDRLSPEAKSIGAINCFFRNENGDLCGTNTDGEGSLKSFINKFGDIAKKKILILGIGGTGKAVSAYFASAVKNLNQIYLTSRSNAANKFAKNLGCNSIEWNQLTNILSEIDILINCTNLGSTLNFGHSPLLKNQIELLSTDSIVYDVIYDPDPTPLIKQSRNRNLLNLNGLGMNLEQAVVGFHYSASTSKLDMDTTQIRNAMRKIG